MEANKDRATSMVLAWIGLVWIGLAACGSDLDEAACEMGSLKVSTSALLSGDTGRSSLLLNAEGIAEVMEGETMRLDFEDGTQVDVAVSGLPAELLSSGYSYYVMILNARRPWWSEATLLVWEEREGAAGDFLGAVWADTEPPDFDISVAELSYTRNDCSKDVQCGVIDTHTLHATLASGEAFTVRPGQAESIAGFLIGNGRSHSWDHFDCTDMPGDWYSGYIMRSQ